ncbi:hypothetical protein JHL21_11355 [Devosia sp. WQ 349]|uniref:hypothetical protein n=1 Tax=Devosia sp. WQ 349K1 TaxID=2800329 RepID=UPI0019086859|nr:hypothetical protein [Devosia sp. WQ 349K1]MBK1795095.1 hypothetical protein [Devosia sp. WQ 349K1]
MARYEALRATCVHADKLYAATGLLIDRYRTPVWYHELDKGFHDLQTKGIDSLGFILRRDLWLVERPRLKLSAEINGPRNLKVRWAPFDENFFSRPGVDQEFSPRVLEFSCSSASELIFMRNPWVMTREEDIHFLASKLLMFALSEYWLWMIGILHENFDLTIESHFDVTPCIDGEYFTARDLNGMDPASALDHARKPLIQTR